MNILAVESSATAAGAAVWSDGELRAEVYNHTRLTHSQTLLPMIADMLRNAQLSIDEMDAFAVAAGPGSFTGVRIGVAAVKGLAFGKNVPCIPVSTLLGMAYLFVGQQAHICAVMDARCGQVYNALFEVNGAAVTRLCADRAIPVDALGVELAAGGHSWVLVGDGAALCAERLAGVAPVVLAPAHLRYQRASAVAMAAEQALLRGESVTDAALAPFYLRPPQAEREWKKKHPAGETPAV